MPIPQTDYYYEIHAKETVHAVYAVAAASETEAKKKFQEGDLPKPVLYEAIDSELEDVRMREF